MKHGCFTICRKLSLPLAILALAGCSYFFAPRVELQRLTLDVAARANDDSPIAVDFVAVKDAELFKELAGLPASQWFANREQYRRDYRQQFAVWSLELVPGQFIESESFPLRGDRATGLLVFAGYNTLGAHRLRLDQQQRVWLRLDTREMRLVNDPATR
ncbi:type VI secretion protein [Pseudomonas aeruginosa]|uniref:type VI secretion protein n=1 Tax=Pseudomonas aeruginosa TaxID=287 RepID=UPI001B368075|nr:type VI secretion protein [Pseudomonas aeruginosa]MBP8471417.1 type VI secretion protein [Pseudomonas aeruginosa]